MDNHVKILSQKLIYKAKYFKVEELQVEIAGKKRIYGNVRRQPSVYVFPLTNVKEIQLVSQYRFMLKKRTIEAVAGFIETGESPVEAATRELKEEGGIVAGRLRKLSVMEMAASVVGGKFHLFLAQDLTYGKQNQDDDENITMKKFPIKEAVEKVLNNEIQDVGTMFGILLIDKLIFNKKI